LAANKETFASKPSQNPISLISPNPTALRPWPPALDTSAHTESASAYPSAPTAPAPTRPHTPPSNESSTAGESPPQSDPAARQTAIAPQSPQIPCSSSSPNQS